MGNCSKNILFAKEKCHVSLAKASDFFIYSCKHQLNFQHTDINVALYMLILTK